MAENPKRRRRKPDPEPTPAEKPPKDCIDPTEVTQVIELAVVPSKGWVYTRGMEMFNLPNLEVRNIPLFLWRSAGSMLMEVADYMLNEKPIKAGETMQLGHAFLKFEVGKPNLPEEAEHYEHEMLLIVDGEGHKCACCENGSCKH